MRRWVRTLARPRLSFGMSKPDHVAKILLAEDHPVNQKVALILLERFGYNAEAVESGRLALDAFQRDKYDLILMDVMMLYMDVLEATRAIRAVEQETSR